MGCPCKTHINTHLGPMWVLYFLLAGIFAFNQSDAPPTALCSPANGVLPPAPTHTVIHYPSTLMAEDVGVDGIAVFTNDCCINK